MLNQAMSSSQKKPEETKSKKIQLHQSHINMFDRCQIAFAFRYGLTFNIGVDGRPHENLIRRPGIALITGTAVHESVDFNMRHKMEEGTLAPHEEVVETAVKSAQDAFQSEEYLLTEAEAENPKDAVGKTLDMTAKLATVHYDYVAPNIDPLGVEEPFVVKMKNYPWDLAGQFDLRVENGFHDTKTAKSTPSDKLVNFGTQSDTYTYGFLVEQGVLPEDVTFDYLIKLKTPKSKSITIHPTTFDLDRLSYRLEIMAESIDAIEKGHCAPTPAINANIDWVCTKNYCGYHDICRAYSGR